MRQLVMASIAALTAVTVLAEAAAAREGVRRSRIVIYPRLPYQEEPGTIYGYAPGSYRVGPYGILYGPYPINPYAPVSALRY
jgi:hypothetical protein